MNTTVAPLLDPKGPVALILRERLRPVGGAGSVIFPPTYAPAEGSSDRTSSYNFDRLSDGSLRCTVDSVASQANRIEAMFLNPPYSELVPQIVVTAGAKRVNLLQAAHRLADAAARFSELSDEVDAAYKRLLDAGDASQIARLSPMAVVFGSWDSRGTQAKLPRLLTSTIFADRVELLTRSSQFNPSFNEEDVLAEGAALPSESTSKWSEAGLAHAPGRALGGVLVRGEIVHEAILNLVGVRHLRAGSDADTSALREYVLALALVALTMPQDLDLRSGCQLVRDGAEAVRCYLVARDGTEKAFSLDHDDALSLARAAATRFKPSDAKELVFQANKALEYLGGQGQKKAAAKGGRSKRA
jgi:CRISPR-associated protein Csb1